MRILGIETSMSNASVSILDNQKIISYNKNMSSNMQAEDVFKLIDQAFAITKLTYQDLQYIAVTTGPGSFTGIRVGLSAVRGIILASKNLKQKISPQAILQPLAFSNFEVACFRGFRHVSNISYMVVVLKEHSGNLFIQTFKLYENDFESYNTPEIIKRDELEGYIQNIKTLGSAALIGNVTYELLKDQTFNPKDLLVLPRFISSNSNLLASLALRKIQQNINSSNINSFYSLEPLYIKPLNYKTKSSFS